MILRLIKVVEGSLEPVYQDGDFVLVSRIPILFGRLRPGDTVVFDHPRWGRMIKIVERMEDGGKTVFVVGLSPDSIDSRRFGPVRRECVLGKVIWRVAKT